MGEKSGALDASSQATVDWLVERLPGESREAVTAVVVKLVGEGISNDALGEAAANMLEAHHKDPKDSPLGYLVAVARAGRKSSGWLVESRAEEEQGPRTREEWLGLDYY